MTNSRAQAKKTMKRSWKKPVIAVMALSLVAAACGGDDDGGGGGSPQDQVADMMLEVLDEELSAEGMEGVSIDEDCVREAMGELSDEDAEAIVAAQTTIMPTAEQSQP